MDYDIMCTSKIIPALLFGVFLCGTAKTASAIEVAISQGKLAGGVLESRNGTKVYTFLGIPYAEPPIGKLRFEPPQKPKLWNGIRNATLPPPSCIQTDIMFVESPTYGQVFGQEDCLYLNVFTPTVKGSSNLPVMVFIHGGAFSVGSANMYKPEYLLDMPIVLVTINYRLGVLGFLSAADEVLSGNYGMKDQVAALKWVKDNIVAFGGNPNKVTIFGESAGATSVHLHLYSPLSTGLFQQAIVQSGSALGSWATLPPDVAREKSRAFGILNGCPTNLTRDLVNCLREISAEELAQKHNTFYVWDFDPIVPFPIVAEPPDLANAFLVENPWRQIVINNVPLIIGITSGEGGFKVWGYLSKNDGQLVTQLNKEYSRIFPLIFGYRYWLPNEKSLNVTKALKEYYFGDEEFSEKKAKELVDLVGNGMFSYPGIEAAFRHPGKVYFYLYDHRNRRSVNELFGKVDVDTGVGHGDDLLSLFPSLLPFYPDVNDSPDLEVSQRMVNYWTNFAKTGNPNNQQDGVWSPLTSDEFEYLHITTEQDKMKKHLLKNVYEFWKSLKVYPTYSTKDVKDVREEL